MLKARLAFFQDDQERLINDGVRCYDANNQLQYTDWVKAYV